MSNPFYFLAGLMMLTAYPQGSEPLIFAKDLIVAPWAALAAVVLYAVVCRILLAGPYSRTPQVRVGLRLLALVLYALLIYVFHFPLWVWKLGVEDDPLASSLLSLVPLLCLFGAFALILNRVEPRAGGLRFAFRGFFGLSLLPVLLLLLFVEAFERIDWLGRLVFIYPSAGWVVVVGGLIGIMVALPPLLRFILGARPMPPGDLRDRLFRLAQAVGYPPSELLVVPTGTSRMANAFVAGLSARWRYVFFTEAILDGMSPDDLDCVLVHEIAHSRKRHIVFYLAGALAFALVTGLAHEALDVPSAVLQLMLVAWVSVYWGLGFGYISRRFETEADLAAARQVPPGEGAPPPYGAARKMAAALQRVADLNRVPVWAWSWRHFTIARRMEILVRSEVEPAVGLGFERTCDRLRKSLLLLVVSGLICGALTLVLQKGKPDENRALLRAHELVEQGRVELNRGNFEEALRHLRQGIEGGSSGASAWLWRSDAERALGLLDDARKSEIIARQLGFLDPRLRLRFEP